MTAALTIENPAYFDRLAAVEERHWWSIGVWTLAAYWLRQALAERTGLRAIDIGCGTGMTAVRLARLPAIDDVCGLDPSENALAHARSRHSFPLVLGSATELPFEDCSFDVATCFDVIQHVPDARQSKAIAELFRILSPGGFLLLRSNGRGWSRDRSAFRLDELMGLVKSARLAIRRASYANCLPALAQEIRGRLSTKAGDGHPARGGLRIAVPSPAVNRILQSVSHAEAIVAGKLGVRLPFGHSTMVLAQRPRRT